MSSFAERIRKRILSEYPALQEAAAENKAVDLILQRSIKAINNHLEEIEVALAHRSEGDLVISDLLHKHAQTETVMANLEVYQKDPQFFIDTLTEISQHESRLIVALQMMSPELKAKFLEMLHKTNFLEGKLEKKNDYKAK